MHGLCIATPLSWRSCGTRWQPEEAPFAPLPEPRCLQRTCATQTAGNRSTSRRVWSKHHAGSTGRDNSIQFRSLFIVLACVTRSATARRPGVTPGHLRKQRGVVLVSVGSHHEGGWFCEVRSSARPPAQVRRGRAVGADSRLGQQGGFPRAQAPAHAAVCAFGRAYRDRVEPGRGFSAGAWTGCCSKTCSTTCLLSYCAAQGCNQGSARRGSRPASLHEPLCTEWPPSLLPWRPPDTSR
jgi:hypothetical protein